MILDHKSFPFRDEIKKWCSEHCADERKEGETEEQFVYKSRKKTLGPFKRRMWEMPDKNKKAIIDDIGAKFSFLFGKLGVVGTKEVVDKHVPLRTDIRPAYRAVSDQEVAMAVVDPNEGE